SISRLFFDSMSISAWKEAGDTRWSLRTNPSSGNLHPTEAYLITPRACGLGEAAGVYHYAPKEHGLEMRAELGEGLAGALPDGVLLVALTSIHWREAWKYGERAFRYCNHDVGHAIACLSIAASGLGWRLEVLDDFERDRLGAWLGVASQVGPEAECPDVLMVLRTSGGADKEVVLPRDLDEAFGGAVWQGRENDLSPDHVEWNAIEVVAKATHALPLQFESWARRPALAEEGGADVPLRLVVRQRRSGLDFDGKTGMSAADFYTSMRATLPTEGRVPFGTLPWLPRVHLAVFVHRVDGVTPGLYWLQRHGEERDALRGSMRDEFLWEPPEGCPEDLPLSLLLPMNLRSQAVSASCTQEIAGSGAYSLGMIAEFEEVLQARGAAAYPRFYWEAGAIGQVLYLEAEACGLRATGIGCYFDDPVHSILGVKGHGLQSVYHFTVGMPVEDGRLTALPAYERGE
ncbi:MAG: SagB-type dehydrogenase family enzyme, partial [Planctomycetota bacterium]